MDYHDCRCPPDFETGISRTLSMENEGKEEEGEQRINLDKMKALMNDEQHDEKLEQNEELAGLRAGVSIAKQQMADQSKRHDFGRNFRKK